MIHFHYQNISQKCPVLFQRSPLWIACESGQVEVAEYFLDKGGQVNGRNKRRVKNCLLYLLLENYYSEIVTLQSDICLRGL